MKKQKKAGEVEGEGGGGGGGDKSIESKYISVRILPFSRFAWGGAFNNLLIRHRATCIMDFSVSISTLF